MNQLKKINDTHPLVLLKSWTTARIGLSRFGCSLSSKDMMELKLAHSRARDALFATFEQEQLAAQLNENHRTINLKTTARDRNEYLLRPDKGRNLDATAKAILSGMQKESPYDVCIVIGDGLSPAAINKSAIPFISLLLPELHKASMRIAPIFLVSNARVAVGDEISGLIQAKMVLVLIGERPGLSVAESMGIYLTYAPRAGVTDADRNCISNIHPEGLSYRATIQKLTYLIREAFTKKISGVALKDQSALAPGAENNLINKNDR